MEIPNSVRILHVEDRTSDADQVARLLKKAGMNVDIKIVSTKDTFRAALTEFAPDLIISDHNLPAFNSMEALEILQKSLCIIPFILVTGTVSEEFAVQAMRAGADDYILKDRMQRLPVAVESVLEKYRLECAKYKTESMLRNIDANSLDIICTISDEGRFLHVSAASELILGYAPSEMVGKSIVDFVFAEDHEVIRKANTLGAKLHNFENRYVRKNGTLVTLSWSARWDESERIRYCVAKDITERKKEELEKLALIEDLQAKNNDLQQFSYIVSHNLRSPISKILGLISIHGFNPGEDQFIIEKIKEATASLDEVVRDINTIVSARKSDENVASVYLPGKLRKVEELLEVEIKESKIVITTDFSQCDTVHAIPSYMLSIIYNLISNAIKYRRKNIASSIHLECTHNNQFNCLSISDNGLGIDLIKNKDKIFGLYKRFHGNEIEGRGIGLNLVKTHAESQGGYVHVESTVNEGTIFKIYIPKSTTHGNA